MHYGTSVEVVRLPAYAGVDVTGADVGGNYAGDFADQARANSLVACWLKALTSSLSPLASGNGVFAAVKEADETTMCWCDV